MQEKLTLQEKQTLFQAEKFACLLVENPENTAVIVKSVLVKAEDTMDRWLDQGRTITALVYGRTWLMDQIIRALWHQFMGNIQLVSLFATGGYGRGELHPSSDIDLLILSCEKLTRKITIAIEHFIALLWDTGLKISTSVRTLTDCSELAARDITVFTSLMEARLLSGRKKMQQQLASVTAPSSMWSSEHYLQATYDEQKKRHYKYNQTSYNLEPDIKESPGGLRDIHMIIWVTKRHYGTASLNHLVDIGFLLPEEYQTLEHARNTLWYIRWKLHRLGRRAEECLLFDHQKIIAGEMGYTDEDKALAIEQFMQTYFRAVTDISTMKDLLLQHFDENILSSGKTDKTIRINERFQLRNSYLEVTRPSVFRTHPPALLELFVLITHNSSIAGTQASTIRLLRSHLHFIDESFRKNPLVTEHFMHLLRAPYGLVAALRKMTRYGVLGRYLPEFARITCQMQYDLYHVYTVEAHTLLLIKFLRRFRYSSHKRDFPVAHEASAQLRAPELIYVAALYHDIAKGCGGNHSELGAAKVENFCRTHQLTEKDTSLVVWLVRHHLIFSITAQRKDLSDPEAIRDFAAFVGTEERLNYLYCLTVADINATNPRLWNSWRASLLNRLYNECRKIFLNGSMSLPAKKEKINQTKTLALIRLQQDNINRQHVTELWKKIDTDYFLQYQPHEIAWHTKSIIKHGNNSKPLVIAQDYSDSYSSNTTIFIHAAYSLTFFATVASVLECLSFNIMDAKVVMTEGDYRINTFVILDAGNSQISADYFRVQDACRTLRDELMQPDKIASVPRQRTPRLLRYFRQPPEIRFSNDSPNQKTVVEVFATDRPGLLAIIANVFSFYGIHVQKAKILTLGERVEDVFFVTDSMGKAVNNPEIITQFTHLLTERLIQHTEKDCYRI